MKQHIHSLLFTSLLASAVAQSPDWQQRVAYVMEVSLDPRTHLLQGKQQLTYYNHSPDTLLKVYYHLYFNAFRAGSMMDVRSRSIEDPDRRVRDRIFHLKENESGYMRISSLRQDGQVLSFQEEGTVLVVDLKKPLLPTQRTVLEMVFEARVPLQVRRSGRDNKEQVAYSMSQWYPKLAEYDHRGWHATPYVGREFHGVWGDFDVTISLPAAYTVAATGLLQTPKEASVYRSSTLATPISRRFVAKQVHDFVWAADPAYVQDQKKVPGGPVLHFFYKKEHEEVWQAMQPYAVRAFTFLSKHYGRYPYPQYSIIQGGDGGMEYPMATLITGARSLYSLVDVVVHEVAHSWYQGLLATNETLYAWMDEGFTTYAAEVTMQYLFPEKKTDPIQNLYNSYYNFLETGKEERMNTMADHFQTNAAYSVASYVKGAVFQHQLSYVVGRDAFARGLRRYFDVWKYRHPGPIDYLRVMEKEAEMELDWYYEYFVQTTHTIDYAIHEVEDRSTSGSRITLARLGKVPMPVDLVLSLRDGRKRLYYIPLRSMWGEKEKEDDTPRHVMSAWPWTHPYYSFDIPESRKEIERIEIDPSRRVADVAAYNQVYPFSEERRSSQQSLQASLGIEGKLLRKD